MWFFIQNMLVFILGVAYLGVAVLNVKFGLIDLHNLLDCGSSES